jgi:hypothetical protein
MTDDPNKRQNDPKQSDEQAGQQQQGHQPGEQQRNTDESSRKRPSQGGNGCGAGSRETGPGRTAAGVIRVDAPAQSCRGRLYIRLSNLWWRKHARARIKGFVYRRTQGSV